MKNYHLLVILIVSTVSSSAVADTLGSRQGQSGVPTAIGKGVFQLGAESSFISSFVSENDVSDFRVNLRAAISLRYFVKDNLGVSARVGGILQKQGDTTDASGAGALWANYYMRLGEGVFLAPGAGAGFLFGERDVPAGTGIARATLVGGTLAFELPITFFTSERFSLKAGPEFTLTAGSSLPEGSDTSTGYTSIDGSFKIGFDYAY